MNISLPPVMDASIARFLQSVFVQQPKIFTRTDYEGHAPFSVAVAVMENHPANGLATCSTVGLSMQPSLFDKVDVTRPRIQVLGSCREGQLPSMREAIFSAARYLARSSDAMPGLFLYNLFGKCRPDTPVPHALLTEPFVFPELERAMIDGRNNVWLNLVPVSDAELEYARLNSVDALETLFETRDIDWTNLDRASIV